jgi:Homeodomain-like domain
MKSAREKMNMIAAYRDVGSYRGAAAICGTTPKTVKRAVQRAQSQGELPRKARDKNTDAVREVVAKRIEKTQGRISARPCPVCGPGRPLFRPLVHGPSSVLGVAAPSWPRHAG